MSNIWTISAAPAFYTGMLVEVFNQCGHYGLGRVVNRGYDNICLQDTYDVEVRGHTLYGLIAGNLRQVSFTKDQARSVIREVVSNKVFTPKAAPRRFYLIHGDAA